MAKFVLVLQGTQSGTFTMSSKIENRCDGLKAVDLIRCTLELEIPLERIESTRNCADSYVEIEIDENLARLSGLFNHSFREIVSVEKGETLNNCLTVVVKVSKDEETGEILNAYLDYQFDSLLFLKIWESNNFPTEIKNPLVLVDF